MLDYAIVPLHHQVNIWASKNAVRYNGRLDERTHGYEFVVHRP
jgi:peptide/nickel transport system substrate-binding protein